MVMLWRMARRRRKEGWEDVFLLLCEVFRVIHPAWSIPLAVEVFAIPVAFFQLKVDLPVLQNLGFLIGGIPAAVILGAGFAGWQARRGSKKFKQADIDINRLDGMTWRDFKRLVGSMYRPDGFTFPVRFLVLAASLATTLAQAAVVYVSQSQTTNFPPDGLSWATAFPGVQTAVDAATEGDEVWVAEGTYVGGIALKSGVGLIGGFAGIERSRDERNGDELATVLDGGQAGSVVIVDEEAVEGTRLESLIIRNGSDRFGGGLRCVGGHLALIDMVFADNTTPGPVASGAGIHADSVELVIAASLFTRNTNKFGEGGAIEAVDCQLTVSNSVFRSCGSGNGAAIHAWRRPTSDDESAGITLLSNNTFEGNGGRWGGAVYGENCDLIAVENLFSMNRASADGGGGAIYAAGRSVRIVRNEFRGNTFAAQQEGSGGGAILLSGEFQRTGIAEVVGNVFLGNSVNSLGSGSAVLCWPDVEATIENNTFIGHVGYKAEAAAVVSESSAAVIANNLIAHGAYGLSALPDTAHYNCFFDHTALDFADVGVNGNFRADPRFTENVAYGDWHLLPGSPCKDAGRLSVADNAVDLDGDPRPQDIGVDIGADEITDPVPQFEPCIVRVSPEGDDSMDGQSWASAVRSPGVALQRAARTGGEVWVREGVYSMADYLELQPFVYLYGGFDGSEPAVPQRDWQLHNSILRADDQPLIIAGNHLPRWAALDGFVLEGINSDRQNGPLGLNAAWITIANNTIRSNRAALEGAAVTSWGSPVFTNNVISDNESLRGGTGGLRIVGGSPLVVNNVFTGNKAHGFAGQSIGTAGGAITAIAASPRIIGNLIVNNSATNLTPGAYVGGGGISLITCTNSSVLNNSIIGNQVLAADVVLSGAGLTTLATHVTAANNLIVSNSSGFATDSEITFSHNNVWGNGGLDFAGIADPTGADGNISADPMFADGDWHLGGSSPCVDAGKSSFIDAGWLDLDGEARVAGLGVDIGADESGSYIPLTVVQPSLADGIVGQSYSVQLEVVAGVAPFAWSLAGGSDDPPDGITLSPDGLLAGIPSVTGDFVVEVQVEDASGGKGSATLDLSILAPALTLRIPPQTASEIAANGCRFVFSSDTAGTYVIERTADFVEWTEVATIVYSGSEEEVVDQSAEAGEAWFYRARLQ